MESGKESSLWHIAQRRNTERVNSSGAVMARLDQRLAGIASDPHNPEIEEVVLNKVR